MATVQELGARVKAKYPGAYDDLDDIDLGRRVQAKHPGAYDDFTDVAPGQVSGARGQVPGAAALTPDTRHLTPRQGPQLEIEPTIERELDPLVPHQPGPRLDRATAMRILAERGDPRAAVVNPSLAAPQRIAGVGANRPRLVARPRRDKAGLRVDQDLSVTPDSTAASRADDLARNFAFGDVPQERARDVQANTVNFPLALPSPQEAERMTDRNAQLAVAAIRGVSRVAQGFTHPESVGMVAGTAGAGALARGASSITGRVAGELTDAFIAAGFSGELAAGAIEAINTGRTAATPAQAVEAYTAGGVQALLSAMGLKHSLGAGRSAARGVPGAAREISRGVREGFRPGGRFRGPANPEVIPPERGLSTERVIDAEPEVPTIDITPEAAPPGGLRAGREARPAPAIEHPRPTLRRLRAGPERPAPPAEPLALPEASPRGTREARIVQGKRIERVFYGEPVRGRDGLEVRPVRITEPPAGSLGTARAAAEARPGEPAPERRLLEAGERPQLPFARPLEEKTVRMRSGRTAKLLSDGTVRITGLVPRNLASRQRLIREAQDALNIFGPRAKAPASPASAPVAADKVADKSAPVGKYPPTPKALADRMAALAELKDTDTVLEPSAGRGDLAEAVGRVSKAKVSAAESDPRRRGELERKGLAVIGDDALRVEGQFSKIVMGPPFDAAQDIPHVRAAYERNLAPGGRLVSLVRGDVFDGREGARFRQFVEAAGGTVEDVRPPAAERGEPFWRGGGMQLVVLNKPGGTTANPRALQTSATAPAKSPKAAAAAQAAKPGAASAPTAIRPQGGRARAKTTRGTEVETRYAVVEASELITSNRDNLAVEPRFPPQLQPRDRTRLSSEEQIARLESQLDPELLAENVMASAGAPIVGADAVVESGNARSIAIRRAYRKQLPTAERYRAFLRSNAERFGLTPAQVEKLQQPVLVRVRETPVDRAQFAVEANEATVAGFSATEQAASDAGRLSNNLLARFQPSDTGELLTAANRDFFRGFIESVASSAERGRLMDAKGQISQEGLTRVRNAVFAKAYGDARAIARLAESADDNARNLTHGLLRAAPKVARLSDAISKGQRHPLGITNEVAEAVEVIAGLREKGQSAGDWLSQENLFEGRRDLVDQLVGAFERHKRSPKRIGEILTAYTDLVEDLGHPKQLQLVSRPVPHRGEILESALQFVEAQYAPIDPRQAGLFGSEGSPAPAHAAPPRDHPTLRSAKTRGDARSAQGAPGAQLGRGPKPANKPARDPRRGAISADFLTLGIARKLSPDAADVLRASLDPGKAPSPLRPRQQSLASILADYTYRPHSALVEGQGGGVGRDAMKAVTLAKDLGEISGGKRLARLMDANLHKLTREQDFLLLDRLEGRLADSHDPAVEEAFHAARAVSDDTGREAVDLGVQVRVKRPKGERPGDDEQADLFAPEEFVRFDPGDLETSASAGAAVATPAAARAPRSKRVAFAPKKDYFPHVVRDLDTLKSKDKRKDIVENLVRQGIRSSEASAAAFYDRYVAYREGQQPHRELLDYLVDTGQSKNREEALALLMRMRRDPSPRRHGNIEFEREVNLPFYDPRPSQVLPGVTAGTSMRLAEIAVLGQDNQVIKAELLKIADAGGNPARVAKSLNRMLGWADQAEIDAERISRVLRVFQGFKLGLAAIPNSSQHLATLIAADLPSFAAGVRAALTKQGKRLAIESSAASAPVLEESLRAMAGSDQKLSKYLRAVGFTATERANRVVAANVGAYYARRLMEQAKAADVELRPADGTFSAARSGVFARGSRGNRKRRERAIGGLRELGIELADGQTELTADNVLMAAKKMSSATQFTARPEDMPIWASTPAGKVFFQFKTFGYNQARFAYRSTWGEFRKGNYGRAIRNAIILATLYPLAGEGVIALRNFLLGRERSDEGWKRYVNNVFAVGSLGLIGDVFQAAGNAYWLPRFAVGPTITAGYDIVGAVAAGAQGNFGPMKRLALSFSPLLRVQVPLTGGLSVERVLGFESIRARRLRWRSDLRSGDAGRRRRAIQEIAAWNRANPAARVAASDLARER